MARSVEDKEKEQMEEYTGSKFKEVIKILYENHKEEHSDELY